MVLGAIYGSKITVFIEKFEVRQMFKMVLKAQFLIGWNGSKINLKTYPSPYIMSYLKTTKNHKTIWERYTQDHRPKHMFDCVLYAGMFGVLFTYIIRKCSTTYYGIFYTVSSYFRKFQMCRNRSFYTEICLSWNTMKILNFEQILKFRPSLSPCY